ncbi:MAG: TrkA family potassium uptake protein [Rikenellaceae bacterium]
MKYIIIGLGNYGQMLARELTTLGHEVIGIDSDAAKIESIKDVISTSFVLDSTDEQSLSILPIRAVDVVIVSIGEAFGASIKTVALLKKNNAKRIYARAIDSVHKAVLEAFNIEMILTPEKDAARSLAQLLDLNVNVESLRLDADYYIVKFKAPVSLLGYKLQDIALEKEFNLKIIALLKGEKLTNNLGVPIYNKVVDENLDGNYAVKENDYLVCYGKYKNFMQFWKSI